MKKTEPGPAKHKAKAKAALAALEPQVVAPAQTASPAGQEEQVKIFDKAVALFRAGDFVGAGKLFEKSARGPVREVAHAARMHAQICARRAAVASPALSSAEDHYNYAIVLINRRELQAAEEHLREAVRLTPGGGHIHYALALVRGLRGDLHQAYESLRRSIELEPRSRAQARNDPDFAEFAHRPPLAGLLFPEREQRS